jgi:hypothetical protein
MRYTENDKAVIRRLHGEMTSAPTYWFLSALGWAIPAGVALTDVLGAPRPWSHPVGWIMVGIALARLGRWFTCLTENLSQERV